MYYLNNYESTNETLSPETASLAAEIFKKNGEFRKSKPKNASGDAKYVWRMVAFYAGLRPEMPATADFDLDEYYWDRKRADISTLRAERREHTKYLDSLVENILAMFPKWAEKGTLRWGRALGKI